ncbi:hypothetical protein [Tepidibacillus sp. HK-1]|uniref:hypothetical protein n=1 Tax=Tepidibacillus sp. HK-1 TaxID=1883407 RepID=UPI000853A76E|nr:hypothetical protein [Tepidibacillus sp. HK-1]GBF11631.1 yceG-like family protein [Tepidibacillus sp. HK-1]
MFSNKNFLKGMGIGFILSSIFLFWFVKPPSETPTPTPAELIKNISIEELKQLITEKGYVIYKPEEIEALKEENKETDSKTPEKVQFVIQKGMTSYKVADLLVSSNIIKDKQQFLNILSQYGLMKNIQIGNYTYHSDMTLDDLISLITHKKVEEWKK